MKKFFTTCIVITSFIQVRAQTYFFTEQQTYINKAGKAKPTEFIWASKYFQNSNFGVFTFALVSSGWGEIYTGPTYTFKGKKPQNFIEVGAGIGIETDPNPYRLGGYLFFNANPDSTGKSNRGKWQGLLAAEYGGSGYWYFGFAMYGISNKFAIGVHAQAYSGVWGPRFQFQTGNLMMYITGGRNLEKKESGMLAAVRYYF